MLNKHDTCVVLDLGNYKPSYAEEIPFVAVITDITDYPMYWITSTITDKKYEIYPEQIFELLSLEETKEYWHEDLINKAQFLHDKFVKANINDK